MRIEHDIQIAAAGSCSGHGVCHSHLCHLKAWLPLEWSAVGVDGSVVIQNVDELQVVALAHHEIIGVVRRRDLHSTWPWSSTMNPESSLLIWRGA